MRCLGLGLGRLGFWVWDVGFGVAQTPRFSQTAEMQVSVMFVPHMTGSCCTHHVDMFRVKG